MTVHKLSAGDGYTYLTRQVASADERRPAGQSLADYYIARGNPPGVWAGSGAKQLSIAGTGVSEAQMKALFGEGRHPDGVGKLGAAYPVYANLAPYAQRVAKRVAEFASLNGRPPSAAERNRIAAVEARRGRRAVAGFDLVFTPVKSASVLWALGGTETRQAVEDAHHEAVAATLVWLEQHAAFTRVGRGGVAQIDTTGLVCAMFDHRESRAGDPDLHTHVAVANKVCGVDGKWRSLDARGLYGLGVAASERYNTRFEDALARRLGVVFVERASGARDLRPVREIDGVPVELIRHFSRRRAAIEERYTELRRTYRATHGREPDRATQIQLAQQATLETREGKGSARTLAEQIEDWTHQASTVVGPRKLADLAATVTGRAQRIASRVGEPGDDTVRAIADQVVRTVAEQRSTWTVWNIHAETERALRGYRFATGAERECITEAVVAHATGPELSIRITEPVLVPEPEELVRASDGVSVFDQHGADRFTTSEILLAEDALIAAGRSSDAPRLDPIPLEAALAIHQARTGLTLDEGQRRLVEAFATSSARIVVGIGPAGAGKTTAMRAFADAWRTNGRRVVPLATSSRAAHVLSTELGARAENLHKFLHENHQPYGHDPVDDWFRLQAGDVVLVDEAGMAGTLQLQRLLTLATDAGATIRLLGDPAQLAAVDAGGALSLLEREVGATHLSVLHRFADPAEGAATLALRAGDPQALAFYTDRDRITSGGRETVLEDAYQQWAADVRAGCTSVLIAPTIDDVSALNARARLERVTTGQVQGDGVALHDDNLAGVGDWIVTRTNARTLSYGLSYGHGRGGARWVHNGDSWRVTRCHRDGSLTVRNLENNAKLRLPAAYVAESVELGYACTAHRAQGATTDTAHALITPEMTREGLYVASTRGQTSNRWYVATDASPGAVPGSGAGPGCDGEPDPPRTTEEILAAVLRRTGSEQSATDTIRTTLEDATRLPNLIGRYEHARNLATLDGLRIAAEELPATERTRVLADKAMPHLALVLADAVGRGARGPGLLRRAFDFDVLDQVASPALVLASRIQDHPHTLGIPDQPLDLLPGRERVDRPLPWLPGPEVGHPGWAPYLRARAALITQRAVELGTLAAAYREHYAIEATERDPLGTPPEPNTRRAHAHDLAQAELTELTARATPAATPPRPAGPQASPPAPQPVRQRPQPERQLSR
jgi:conjugative relaxase-like TrwC/TraI family protein